MKRDEQYYKGLWETMVVNPDKASEVDAAAREIIAGRDRYAMVQEATGCPWYVVGVVHQMEGGGDWPEQILNCQRWDRKTTIVPKPLGPWSSWEESAIFALNRFYKCWCWKPRKWDIGSIGLFLERWNGMAYATRGKHSPYLWSYSNHGVGCGKFVEDGKYDPKAESKQPGAAVILRQVAQIIAGQNHGAAAF